MEKVYEIMPKNWKEEAKNKKALLRGRNIKTPEELLRLVFLYQTSGESYGLTSALTQISENQEGLNKTAVQKRIVNSADWLQWLCENLCRQEGFLTEPPEWLKNYRVCMVDASDYAVMGSKKSDFRLHYMTELFSLNATEMYFTSSKEGETLSRYKKIKQNDLIIADRVYGTITGISHVLGYNADFLIRLRSNSFNLYDSDKKRFDLTEKLKDWEQGKTLDLNLFFKKALNIFQ